MYTRKVLTYCEKCEKPYNLANRAPIVHSCCNKSTCKECWLGSFHVNGRFNCFHVCDEPNTEDPTRPNINPIIRKVIEPVLPLEIVCDRHPKERINGYSMEEKKFTCIKCPKVADKMRYKQLDYGVVQNCAQKMVDLMNFRMEELKENIETFT